MKRPYRNTELQDKQKAQREHASALKRQLITDASPEGQARIAAANEFCASMRTEMAVLEAIRKLRKETGQVRLFVIANTAFAEPADGKPRDLMLDERRLVGQVMGWLRPTEIITVGNRGAERMAAIWGERNDTPCTTKAPGDCPGAAVAFGEGVWSGDCVARLEALSVPVYRARLAGLTVQE